ncbi:MAG: hypothetical protein SPG65_00130 [Campylobacter sp.]|nr:hypothetical protein [Campylobacter sp.]
MRRINKALCLFIGSSCGCFLLSGTRVSLLFYLRHRTGVRQAHESKNRLAILEPF